MYTKKIPLWESIIYCFKMTLQTTHYELGFWYNKVIHKSFFLDTDLLLGKLQWNTLKPSLDYFNFCIQFDVNKKCWYLEFLFEIGKFHPIGYHHILNLEFSKWRVNPKSSLLYQFLKTILFHKAVQHCISVQRLIMQYSMNIIEKWCCPSGWLNSFHYDFFGSCF